LKKGKGFGWRRFGGHSHFLLGCGWGISMALKFYRWFSLIRKEVRMVLFWPVVLGIARIARVIAVIVGPFIALHNAGPPDVPGSKNSKRKWLKK